MLDKPAEEKIEFLSNIEKLLAHSINKCIVVGKIWDDFSKENKNEKIIFKSGLNEALTIN